MSKTERIIAIVAGVITIVNFLFAIPPLLTQSSVESHSILQNMTFSSRVVFLAIIETLLAYAFGLIFGYAAKMDNPLTYAIYIVASMISAWVSIFNVQYFFLIDSLGPDSIGKKFVFGCIGVGILSLILGFIHISNSTKADLEEAVMNGFLWIQISAFLLVALSTVHRII